MESKLGDDEIVGRSFAFQQVLNLVRMVANTDSVTLIKAKPVPEKSSSPAPFISKARAGRGGSLA